MNETERYEFDRQGYIVIEDLLDPGTVSSLSAAVDELEAHALENLERPPRKVSPWGPDYHRNPERGYHADGSNAEGGTVIIEDFWNADERFDALVNDARTMAYVSGIVQGRSTINNSEIRIRYRGNLSGLHGGMRPENQKYRYGFNANGIDCMMVRMVYFIHDVSREHGAFCVIPGTHKTNLPCPYDGNPDEEPGVVALEVKAGDAILFTENLRHGGVTNRSDRVRKTIPRGLRALLDAVAEPGDHGRIALRDGIHLRPLGRRPARRCSSRGTGRGAGLEAARHNHQERMVKMSVARSVERSVEQSMRMYRRAEELIPGWTQLISRRASQFANGVSPVYAESAKGARFVDVDGNEYLDMMNAVSASIPGSRR